MNERTLLLNTMKTLDALYDDGEGLLVTYHRRKRADIRSSAHYALG
jgi:hypothetical protein